MNIGDYDVKCPQINTPGLNYWKSQCEIRKSEGICKTECAGTPEARKMKITALTMNIERDETAVHCSNCGDKIENPRVYGGSIVDVCTKKKCKDERRRLQIRECKRRGRNKNG